MLNSTYTEQFVNGYFRNTTGLLGQTIELLVNATVLLGNVNELLGNATVLLGNANEFLGNSTGLLGNELLGNAQWEEMLMNY